MTKNDYYNMNRFKYSKDGMPLFQKSELEDLYEKVYNGIEITIEDDNETRFDVTAKNYFGQNVYMGTLLLFENKWYYRVVGFNTKPIELEETTLELAVEKVVCDTVEYVVDTLLNGQH